ncbi:MAG: glycoside hydrolase family 127 protein [Dysgonamonadaceae bacterium]|nr:glycoside hydrolase family 127 protein [Dysgonamonadaceae bacterium]
MNGWAQNSINTVIFRSNSIVSYDTVQFIAYYNPEGYLCIGKKNMEKEIWDIRQTAFKGNIQDAHNSISIMTDGEGYLHVAWNHHDSPLNYTKSKFPLSADLEERQAMTGRMENKVTYPQFYKTNSGNLLFMYREGQSGKGNLALKSYNTQTKKWTQLHDNLIDGEGLRNAYWQACIDKNDVVHLSWVWRESPDVASNHDMCYARSTDGGKNWINSKGIKYNLPITAKNAEYVSYIPQNSELINQTSMTADQEGRPYIATYYRKTNTSVPQYHIIYPDHTNEWKDISLDFRKTPFTLTGQGTKKIPISRPLILCRDNPEEKQFLLIYRDEERNCKISMAVCNNLTENQWILDDLTSYPVGDWEPTYDTERWKNQQVLNLFVQKTEQGDGEKTSALNSQPVSMLQVPFLSSYKQQNKEKQPDYQIQQVKLNHVELADRFWLPKIRIIQEKTIRYAFDKCTTEGRLENFVTAGKVINGGTGKTRGVMPFDDTDVYKTIEGAAYSLINAPDPSLMTYLDSIIEIIRSGQEPDGYLTTWRTIHPSRPPASWVKQGGGRWSDLGSSHELYNSGHLFEAAAAHYWATGKRNFLDIALKNADLLINVFGDSTNYEVPGHQIVETGLIKLYQITGKKEYLHLAKKFLDLRGDALHRSVYGAYSQDHLPVTQQIEAVGHAVRAMYMYAGMTDIAALYNDPAYLYAVWQLWENTSGKKIYITGGLGARHEGEAFGDNYELPNLTAYSETCAAIGGVYWNERMFRLTGEAKYYDLIERMLYNAVIAGISLNGTEFFYPNPLEADGKYPFNQGACTRQAWFDCSCCPTNLIRFIPFIPNLIYATQDDTVYINLFMSNKANIPVGKKEVEIEQKTDYPWNENIYLNIKTTQIFPFTIKIRIPGWARNEVVHSTLYSYVNKVDESYRILLNGMPIEGKLRNGYLEITRKWTTGDQIELQFPMTVRQVKANEKVTVNAGKTAIEYGPLVYCMEEIDNPSTFDNKREMNDAAEYTVEWKNDFLDGVNIIREKKNRNEQVLIPYYAWSNRGAGKMKVWK